MSIGSPASYLGMRKLTKSYPNAGGAAVDGVTLDVGRGDFLALLGPSGCGKTTTLRMIAGLLQPTSGSITLDGLEITRTAPHRRGMGFVFQNYALFPHMDVAANVGYGLRMRRLPKSVIARKVMNALSIVQLTNLADRRVTALSGGQQQRVALARALVIEPSVLLMDEPLSNLDAKLRETMRSDIQEIQRRLGITTVFVTHDQTEALTMADRVGVMFDGRLVQVGTPSDIFDRPATRFVAEFIGRANFVTGIVTSKDTRGAVIVVKGAGQFVVPAVDARQGAQVTLMIRPHQLLLEAAHGGQLSGSIVSSQYRGEMIEYQVSVGAEVLTVSAIAGSGPIFSRGDAVDVNVRAERLHVVDTPPLNTDDSFADGLDSEQAAPRRSPQSRTCPTPAP